jgi:photosystem II stability/assembly factor-like uncharacterized protein
MKIQTKLFVAVLVVLCAAAVHGQSPSPQSSSPLGGMRWRMIGPFRGGRSIAVSGIEGRPNVYYFGGVGGGVWTTNNSGLTWQPIFDSAPIASIGALAVVPSKPYIIYVGTGEADLRSDLTYGDGVYKTTDGGQTWTNIGLRDSQHIARIVVDPHNPNVVLVAALGHAYGPNRERGVFRSTDGGANWQRVLFKDENTGAIDLAVDPDNPQTVFAALWSVRRPPWSVYAPVNGGGAIYRSDDGGAHWAEVKGGGLPETAFGRVGLAIARGTNGRRVYALIDTEVTGADAAVRKMGGLYRSDDGGRNWMLTGTDPRIKGRGWYFGEVIIDPKNPDIVYLPNVAIYRSQDGGHTFEAIKGAPGGDDYHAMWIDQQNPARMIFGSDQGVGVSVDGGRTWSSWYNQPTGQFYHVATDNAFPYRVYGAQQDSGTAATVSRSDTGSITFRDWYSVGAGESGYIAPDPNDPNMVYGGDTYGGLHRFDRRTGQAQNIAPAPLGNFGDISRAEVRFTWTSPLVFASDGKTLYYGSQYLLRSPDRGMSWERVTGDLTGAADPDAPREGPTTSQNARARGYGVIYTIAPSAVDARTIWLGTDTGLIWLTRDGGASWKNVTPPGLSDWSKISMIDAGHFDAGTAYAAVDRHRLDDLKPHVFRTHDFGATWQEIANGIPDGAYVRSLREDPVRKGLLFAGTELGVFFSLEDGGCWQSLRLNMPVAPVHDLVIKNNDLVVATHGRAFWILDDISPLRQMEELAFGDDKSCSASPPQSYLQQYASLAQPVRLFKPAVPIRIRRNTNNDTPLPPEEPAGENPPTGAVIYYSLAKEAQGEVSIEILDSSGAVVRRYASTDPVEKPPANAPFTQSWFRPPERVETGAGLHRLVWDLRYARVPMSQPSYSMAVAFGQSTLIEPEGPQVLPGQYGVRMTAAGRTFLQPLEVKMDPRVATSAEDLKKQFDLEMKIYEAMKQANAALDEIRGVLKSAASDSTLARAVAIAGVTREGTPPPAEQQAGGGPTLTRALGTLGRLAVVVDSADAAPTTQAMRAAEKSLADLRKLLAQWEEVKKQK